MNPTDRYVLDLLELSQTGVSLAKIFQILQNKFIFFRYRINFFLIFFS